MREGFESGVMLDMGRKYFSPVQIKRLVSELKALGCNSLMLHFSEDMGLGLESPDFPWLAGRDYDLCVAADAGQTQPDLSVLSVAELRDIISFANENGIEIIPSYDSPGHLNYTVRKFNEYVKANGAVSFREGGNEFKMSWDGSVFRFYKNGNELGYPTETSGKYGIWSYYLTGCRHGIVKGTKNEDCSRGIDISNEVAVAFIRAVLYGYAKLFYDCGCRKIDLGGDEMLGFGTAVEDLKVLSRWQQLDHWQSASRRATGLETAVAYDLLVMYMNGLCRTVRDMGYRSVRVWNDEFRRTSDTGWTLNPAEHVQFEKNIKVQYWSGRLDYEPPVSLADNGYELINCDSTYCYYVLLNKARCTPPSAFENVTVERIASDWTPYGVGARTEGKPHTRWELDTDARRRSLCGAYFCVWCDDPAVRSDREVIDELLPLLRVWKGKVDSRNDCQQ